MSICDTRVNRTAARRVVSTMFSKQHGVESSLRKATMPCGLLGALVLALLPCAIAQQWGQEQKQVQTQPGAQAGVTQRYGNFSIVWPAQPRLVENPANSTESAAV